MKPLALYIHVPFCAQKCVYCDFASWPDGESEWRRYFDELVKEIRLWSGKTDFGLLKDGFRVRSAFIGGGTPTLVPAEYIADVLDRCRGIAPFEEDVEITIEGNPGTLTSQKLEVYRRAGIHRLSLGAQSFDDDLLRSLGRIHSARQIREAVKMARDAGFSNINLDLMYGLPGQTMEQWADTLACAVELDVTHISAYSLIVEEGTPMAARVSEGRAILPGDDRVNAMQRLATEALEKADYGRYEISNYARAGYECRHNLTYWRRGDYLGLGCAAHSLMDECRFANPTSLDQYLAGVRRVSFERLTPRDVRMETVMLTTRTTEGLDLRRWVEKWGTGLTPEASKRIRRLCTEGLLETNDDRLRLTPRGMEVQNAVVLELLNLLEESD